MDLKSSDAECRLFIRPVQQHHLEHFEDVSGGFIIIFFLQYTGQADVVPDLSFSPNQPQ